MKQALRSLSGFARSVIRGLTAPAAFRPDLAQTGRLAALVPLPEAAAPSPEDRAVAFFAEAAAAAGVLPAERVAEAVAAYREARGAWCAALIAEAEHRCRASLPIYARQGRPLGDPVLWVQPVDGAVGEASGDRLYQLRPQRFGFLPRLAMAAAAGADCLPVLLAALDHWIARAGRPEGAADAYFSNLVVIYRLVSITWAAPFLAAQAQRGDTTAARICARLFRILAADAQYLQPRLGDSVGNNHLLADRFAAWFLATAYPALWSGGDRAALERAWQEELARQFQPDGTNFEQSTHYHELGCEMALVYFLASLRRGETPAARTLTLIREMLRFQAALGDEAGGSFSLGDATDDPLLPLDAGAGGCAGGAWRTLYNALFDAAAEAPVSDAKGAERASWLLAALPCEDAWRDALPTPQPPGDFAVFPDNGYTVFHEEAATQSLLFRSGPRPGVETSPGHAMADLLSVYWSAAGGPLLEPSGTYSYSANADQPGQGPARARDYFRSPAAHNGLVLAGHDPLGVPRGRFRGPDNGTRVITAVQGVPGLLAWAEGRLEEDGPLHGYRRGVLQVCGRYVVVYDRLPALPAQPGAACHWQFAPEARVELGTSGRATVDRGGFSAFFSASDGLSPIECVQGRTLPPAGWVSRRYGEVVAAPQLICPLAPGLRDLAFVFGPLAAGAEPPVVEVLAAEEGALTLQVRQGQRLGVACFGGSAGAAHRLPFDLDFEGDALWIETDGAACRDLRTLGLRRLRCPDLGLALTEEGAAALPDGWQSRPGAAMRGGLCGRWERGSDG